MAEKTILTLPALHSQLNRKVISGTKNWVMDCIPPHALYKPAHYFFYCSDCFQSLKKPTDTPRRRGSAEVRAREQGPGDERFASCRARLFRASPTPLLFHPQNWHNEPFKTHDFRLKPPSKEVAPFLNASRLTS